MHYAITILNETKAKMFRPIYSSADYLFIKVAKDTSEVHEIVARRQCDVQFARTLDCDVFLFLAVQVHLPRLLTLVTIVGNSSHTQEPVGYKPSSVQLTATVQLKYRIV